MTARTVLDGIKARAEAYASHGTPGLHAPKDRATLLAALEAVLGLHSPDTYGECRRCHGGNGFYHAYPCPTVAAIENALNSKEGQ